MKEGLDFRQARMRSVKADLEKIGEKMFNELEEDTNRALLKKYCTVICLFSLKLSTYNWYLLAKYVPRPPLTAICLDLHLCFSPLLLVQIRSLWQEESVGFIS